MKLLVILLLFGISFSFNCFEKYITKLEKGFIYYSMCTCPNGLYQRYDHLSKTCNCFLLDDILACSKDYRCDPLSINGCSNKK